MDSSGRTAQEDLAKQKSLPKTFIIYGAQNEAYNVERGRKTAEDVYLQRVARVEAMRSAQNETFT